MLQSRQGGGASVVGRGGVVTGLDALFCGAKTVAVRLLVWWCLSSGMLLVWRKSARLGFVAGSGC